MITKCINCDIPLDPDVIQHPEKYDRELLQKLCVRCNDKVKNGLEGLKYCMYLMGMRQLPWKIPYDKLIETHHQLNPYRQDDGFEEACEAFKILDTIDEFEGNNNYMGIDKFIAMKDGEK